MAKRKISKKSKRRLTVFLPIALIIISFFVFNLVSYSVKIVKLMKEENELREKLSDLESEEKDLSNEITKLKDPEYIAKYAREKYYYSKNGEYVIKLEEKDKNDTDKQNAIDYQKYIMYGGCITLFLVFVFILKKRKKGSH